MKAKSQNPEINYSLKEGKHKKTFLEKYLSNWGGEERVNASVSLDDDYSDFIPNNNIEVKQTTPKIKDKEFLLKFSNNDAQCQLCELEDLVSKRHSALSNNNIKEVIRKTYE